MIMTLMETLMKNTMMMLMMTRVIPTSRSLTWRVAVKRRRDHHR